MRSRSFGSIAEAYDRYRPGPPHEAVRWVLSGSVGTALDLGAGTGALARTVRELGARVLAVEPDPRMLEVLVARSPGVSAVRGVGEALPVAAGCMDAVVVSSAWHWMDPDRAVPEVARVLRPGGTFGALWNGPDREVAWVAELFPRVAADGSVDSPPSEGPRARPRHVMRLAPGDAFGPPSMCAIGWTRPMTADDLVGLAGTYSGVITMAASERERWMAAVGAVAARLTDGGERVMELPMRCRCWRAVRR
ncbi:MAG TPA: class I SAM-dependent methyltransferase [Acidimicrobiales bacterium]|nr:class I SAM-dependent methyltransferase [Acidimicrobiales bacterium]